MCAFLVTFHTDVFGQLPVETEVNDMVMAKDSIPSYLPLAKVGPYPWRLRENTLGLKVGICLPMGAYAAPATYAYVEQNSSASIGTFAQLSVSAKVYKNWYLHGSFMAANNPIGPQSQKQGDPIPPNSPSNGTPGSSFSWWNLIGAGYRHDIGRAFGINLYAMAGSSTHSWRSSYSGSGAGTDFETLGASTSLAWSSGLDINVPLGKLESTYISLGFAYNGASPRYVFHERTGAQYSVTKPVHMLGINVCFGTYF